MNTMKKQTILFITISILIMLLTACASSELSSSQIPGDAAAGPSPSQELEQDAPPADAPPAVEFSSAEDAVEHIKAVKAAGAEKMAHSGDFDLYEKDYIYLLKETSFCGFEQAYIMITTHGTAIRYREDTLNTVFSSWIGYDKDERIEHLTKEYDLDRYEDTKFYFGEDRGEIYIFWWENGDQFWFTYPADTNIAPEDVIEHLEVEKFDV